MFKGMYIYHIIWRMIPYLIASTQLFVSRYNFRSNADSIFFMFVFLSISNFYYEQIVMDSSNLEETYVKLF
jgi:tryptophan-rich sensory protein